MTGRTFLARYGYLYCLVLALILLSAAALRHTVETVSAGQVMMDTVRIVIDAGHGGMDSGTTSVSGMPEKTVNLQIARRLEKLLLLLGRKPVMTRTGEGSIHTEGETIREQKRSDLRNRLAIIHARENSLLVSIHQNHFPDPRYTGPQVFAAGDETSRLFAQVLQRRLNTALGTTREWKVSSGVYLMEHLTCPGVLVECGFLSNPGEDQKLQTPEYQKALCCILACALMEYGANPS